MKRWRVYTSTVRKYRTVEVKKKSDGKKWETAVSGIQCVFGIIQFVSSTKEEFKIRLAEV